MSAIRPAGSPEQPEIYKAEVKNGHLFINGLRHNVYRVGDKTPVNTPLIKLIAQEVTDKNIKPGQELHIGEYTFITKPKEMPVSPDAKTANIAKNLIKPIPAPRPNPEQKAAPTASEQENRPPMPAQAPLKPVMRPVRPPRKDEIQ